MGVLPGTEPKASPVAKRKSTTVDFAKLGPLKSEKASKNFSGYRDGQAGSSSKQKLKSKGKDDDMDSENDMDEDDEKATIEQDDKDDIEPSRLLSPEDAEKQAALSEGVKKINLVSF